MLRFLDISRSRVSDKGLCLLTGVKAPNEVDDPTYIADSATSENPENCIRSEGCFRLEQLILQSCDWISEKGLKHILSHILTLKKHC